MRNSLTIVIGDKNFSSWSMRPWVLLKASGLKFREVKIGLDRPDTAKRIKKVSPNGLVPALIHGKTTVWDSLAICEYIAELAPEAKLLPADPKARALMRSYVAEMHSGFSNLRNQMSMDINLRMDMGHLMDGTIADIERILELWENALKKSKGPFLFGHFTIADAFFAPVVTRFVSYGVRIRGPRCRAYMKAMQKHPAVAAWVKGARKERPYRVKF